MSNIIIISLFLYSILYKKLRSQNLLLTNWMEYPLSHKSNFCSIILAGTTTK